PRRARRRRPTAGDRRALGSARRDHLNGSEASMGFMGKMKMAAESAQAATSKVGVGASADQMALANKAKRLTDVGVETPAHIDSMTSTGKTDAPGGTEHVIALTVKPASA